MKKSLLALVLLICLASCSTSFKRIGYKNDSTVEDTTCSVIIAYNVKNIDSDKRIGAIVFNDNDSKYCTQEEVITKIKSEACHLKAKFVNIYNIIKPSYAGALCYQATADFYKEDPRINPPTPSDEEVIKAKSNIAENKEGVPKESKPKTRKKRVKLEEENNNEIESWYFAFYLGYANMTYPEPLQSDLAKLKSMGFSHLPLSIGFGLYWPFSDEKTMAGIILQGASDSYSYSNVEANLNTYLLGPSLCYYLNGKIGDGFYVKSDIGMAWMIIDDNGRKVSSKNSIGFELGLGLAVPISSGTRINAAVSYSNKIIESESVSSINFNVGFLF